MNTYLNLVFHYLSDNPSDDWTLTIEKYFSIINGIDKLIELKRIRFSKYRIYFDDGERSFFDNLYPLVKDRLSTITLGITTDFIGKSNYLKAEEIKFLKNKGVNIASHGVSHAAVAIYDHEDIVLLPTLEGGSYKNLSAGKTKRLKENEVVFQYLESYKKLISLVGEIDEFIFPYGLYNDRSLQINDRLKLYRYLTTCDSKLDSGSFLRPRYLINNSKPVTKILDEVSKLELYDV